MNVDLTEGHIIILQQNTEKNINTNNLTNETQMIK